MKAIFLFLLLAGCASEYANISDGPSAVPPSGAGLNGAGSSMAYDASKAGLIILTKDLARGLAPEVRVNAVAPGVVDTAWTSTWPTEHKQRAVERAVLKRICTPQDIADVIVFLCVGTTMVTGQTIVIDGGASL